MRISNQFTVDLPPEATWDVLLDVERIAPCLPGAQLQGAQDGEYEGLVKVKVGSIIAGYRGTARFVRTDPATHTAQLVATGSETRGQGRAQATVDLAVVPDGTGSRVDVQTDLQVSGKVAQFGRNVMQDVSSKLIDQFATSLRAELAREGAAPGAATTTAPSPSAPRAEPEPVDLVALGGSAVAKQLVPLVGVALLAALVGWLLARRRTADGGRDDG